MLNETVRYGMSVEAKESTRSVERSKRVPTYIKEMSAWFLVRYIKGISESTRRAHIPETLFAEERSGEISLNFFETKTSSVSGRGPDKGPTLKDACCEGIEECLQCWSDSK